MVSKWAPSSPPKGRGYDRSRTGVIVAITQHGQGLFARDTHETRLIGCRDWGPATMSAIGDQEKISSSMPFLAQALTYSSKASCEVNGSGTGLSAWTEHRTVAGSRSSSRQ